MMRVDTTPLLPIRISDHELEKILDALDSHVIDRDENRRRSPRFSIRKLSLTVIIAQQGMPPTRHIVRARNLSAHGLGFLSTAVMLPGTQLRVVLPSGPGGQTIEKPAIVRRCTHIRGRTHEIGAEFGYQSA